MNFPGANRDPEAFEDPRGVVLDRAHNRHVALGSGIHRCAGSNLARMELRVALEEWLRRIPEFQVAEGADVTWAGGQVRGPRVAPGGVPMKIRVVPKTSPGPRPLLRPGPRTVLGRRIRPVVGGGDGTVPAELEGQGPAGHRQLPRIRHRSHRLSRPAPPPAPG